MDGCLDGRSGWSFLRLGSLIRTSVVSWTACFGGGCSFCASGPVLGDRPAGSGVVASDHESSQIDGGHAEGELSLVGFDSSIADPAVGDRGYDPVLGTETCLCLMPSRPEWDRATL